MNKITLTLIFTLLSSIIFCDKQLITFNNETCEKKAVSMFTSALNSHNNNNINNENDIIMLEEIGVMIINIDEKTLTTISTSNENLNKCIKSISKNSIVTLDTINNNNNNNKNNDIDKKQWHLKRINVNNLPLPSSFTRKESNKEVHVYIIDSGIDGHHKDLKSRISPDESTHKDFTYKYDEPLVDEWGHGTHCAGLVASPISGYNTHAILHSVKVFDILGGTTNEKIVTAMNWVIVQHKQIQKYKKTAGIVSMSFNSPLVDALNQGATRIRKAGILPIVSAGNDNKNTKDFSPASAKGTYTVGATDINDSRADFSNYGSEVNIYAPGDEIWSCMPKNSYEFKSGTSMATPFVAGFASYLAAVNNLTNPDDIVAALDKHVTKNKVTDIKEGTNAIPYDGGNISIKEEFLKYLS